MTVIMNSRSISTFAKRLGWLIAIWTLSVAALGAVAMLLRMIVSS